MQDNRVFWKRVFPLLILFACIIASLAVYRDANRRMTVNRNAQYVEDAAIQTAKRISDLLNGAENSIRAIARLYGQTMDPEEIDVAMLQQLADNTPFDYIGIVDVNGVYTDNRGMQAQVSDRNYFSDGMKGNAGMDFIFNSRLANENLMIFYAPLWCNGEVTGILTGRYREYQMREIISTTYFEEPASTYLCLSDGTVLSSSSDEKPPENIIFSLRQNEEADQDTVEILAHAMETGASYSLTYTSDQGSNAAYVTKLSQNDWRLLQVFPIQVTNAMLSESNAATLYLEL